MTANRTAGSTAVCKDVLTLGSRGYFFLIDTDGSRRSWVNEEKHNLWSQECAASFPCEKSVQNLGHRLDTPMSAGN